VDVPILPPLGRAIGHRRGDRDAPGAPGARGRRGPVSRPGHWARSPLDYHAHLLLPEGDHPPGVLKTRCGDVMMTNATRHDQRPPGLTCQRCVFLAGDCPRDE